MDEEKIVKDIVSGQIKLYEVEKHVDNDNDKATELRRRAIEKLTGQDLKQIGHHNIDLKQALKANIENCIGVAQIPMGITGPLKVNGNFAKGEYYIPLATTEGALVASVSRGISVINACGGAFAHVLKSGTTRGPVCRVDSLDKAKEVMDWVAKNKKKIKEIAEKTDPFIKFSDIESYLVGKNLFLRITYDTGDAMGMNMVTVASDSVMSFLEDKFKLKHIALSGNMCIDKKPSALNMIKGRGKSVIAEVTIPRELVEKKLKCTPEAFADVCYRKNWVGSGLAGAYGFNSHFGNIVGAMFLATGQDEAHITEGSHGFTTAEVNDDGDLYVAITAPSLMVGTIGGGTMLGTQKEALSMMGCWGPGKTPGANAKTFAEILGSVLLAGELSLLGALAARHLTQAHVRLNR